MLANSSGSPDPPQRNVLDALAPYIRPSGHAGLRGRLDMLVGVG